MLLMLLLLLLSPAMLPRSDIKDDDDDDGADLFKCNRCVHINTGMLEIHIIHVKNPTFIITAQVPIASNIERDYYSYNYCNYDSYLFVIIVIITLL